MKYLAAILLFILLSCENSEMSKQIKSPNIVLILADDQGWGDLSIHGNNDVSTPHIDHLFQSGTEFQNFYVSPVCSPTRAELLTGRYHVRSGVYSTSAGGERLDLDEETIAEVFSRAGYRTGAFGKWHNGTQYPYHPNGRGFDEYFGFASGHWGHYFSPMLEQNQEVVTGDGYLPDEITTKALSFIDKSIQDDRAFFAFIPFNTPHSPMQVPDKYWSKFEDKKLIMSHPDQTKSGLLHTRAALAMMENIDDNVGRLMTHLENQNILENTIVLFLSDNGPNGDRWNNCLKGRKGSTDEGGVKSPFAIQWKNTISAHQKVESISSAIDILPTLTDLARIPYQMQNSLDGISLKSQIMTEKDQMEDQNGGRYIYNYWRGHTSVRSQQYRLSSTDLLFDLVNDPCQQTDISKIDTEVFDQLVDAKQNWINTVLVELETKDNRAFTIGHPSSRVDHLPARDGIATGELERSNKYPNDSFWLNWKTNSDSIIWDVEVLEPGKFQASIFYTCKKENVGSRIKLTFKDKDIVAEVNQAHDPPLIGMNEDRFPRAESYVKSFKEMDMGTIELKKGIGHLILSPDHFTGEELIDFRLLLLRRV